jgi:hypothetical protein
MDERMRRMLQSGAAEPDGAESVQPGTSGLGSDWTAPYSQPGRTDGGRTNAPGAPRRPSTVAQAVLNAEARGQHDEAVARWVPPPTVVKEVPERDVAGLVILTTAILLIAFIALLPRVFFLYRLTDTNVLIPSWSNDTWHRWQIAYLSKEIGFSHGFLRLWDLKGLEYYWGILHPLMLDALFALTGSVDVMIMRWLTIIAGVVNIVLIFLIGRRFWNTSVGVAAALLAIFNPIVIFNDPSGMVEPLGFAFLLAGVYFFPKRATLAGVMWALAAMSRAEAWLFSAGLILAAMLSRESAGRKMLVGLGWGLPMLAYMKYLLDHTGNAIYPIYWNFLANAAGQWEFRSDFANYQLAARPVLGMIFLVCVGLMFWTLWRRPRWYLLFLLGFGATAFVSGFIGLTHYLKSYEPWFWLTRFFVFPYIFIGVLVAAFALGWLPEKSQLWGKLRAGWLIVAATLVGLQLIWPSVLYDVDPGYTKRTSVVELETDGKYIGGAYTGGAVLIPEGIPQLTYALGRYSGIPGSRLIGQMYGPDYYFQGGDPLGHWDVVGPQMWEWFEREQVQLLVMRIGDQRFERMIAEHPERFNHYGSVAEFGLEVYQVKL